MSSMRWQTEGFDVPQGVSLGCFVLAKSIAIQIFYFPTQCVGLQCERRERARAIAEIPQNSTPHRIPRKHNAMFVSATSNDARSSGVTVGIYFPMYVYAMVLTPGSRAGQANRSQARQAAFRDQTGPGCARRRPRPGGTGVREKSSWSSTGVDQIHSARVKYSLYSILHYITVPRSRYKPMPWGGRSLLADT